MATKERAAERLLLSPREAGELLGIGETFMRSLLRSGQLRSLKVGTLTKIPRDELERFVATRLQEAEDKAGADGSR
jgi:excisionase family DNA binding protein